MSAKLPFSKKKLLAAEKLEVIIKDIMTNAIKNEHNVIFYGRPGYGKSSIVKKVLKVDLGIPDDKIYIMDFSIGTTESRIKGGIDMKKFKDAGEIVYKIQESFMVYEYVIFEEFFDALPEILNSLKAILTRKSFAQGASSQEVKLKTKSIFALTNREPDEIAQRDAATEAMVDRFQLRFKVEWQSYKYEDYKFLVDEFVAKDKPDYDKDFAEEMCKIASAIQEDADRISPRDFVAIIKEGRQMIDYTKGKKPYSNKTELERLAQQLESYKTWVKELQNIYVQYSNATGDNKKALALDLKRKFPSPPEVANKNTQEYKELAQIFENIKGQVGAY